MGWVLRLLVAWPPSKAITVFISCIQPYTCALMHGRADSQVILTCSRRQAQGLKQRPRPGSQIQSPRLPMQLL